jgi:uncharacterized repeat protein (TIGR03803 family)
VLYSFQGGTADGAVPVGNLVFDTRGSLYGTTAYGGTGTSRSCDNYPQTGCGVVFQLTNDNGQWNEAVLHSFEFGVDGSTGNGSLILDAQGNVYGTTEYGGTAFELLSGQNWTEDIIDSFSNYNDGQSPQAGLIWDGSGGFYGTTSTSGKYDWGTAFHLTLTKSGWVAQVIHNFCHDFNGPCNDGAAPLAIVGADGNLYGTTQYGCEGGCGVLFQLSAVAGKWKFTVLHKFTGPEGSSPVGALTPDGMGNFYGTTTFGGAFGCGTLYKLAQTPSGKWKYSAVYNFQSGLSAGSVALDRAGNVYGATFGGEEGSCNQTNNGEVFKLTPRIHAHWKYTPLYQFTGGQDGGQPSSGLISDANGNLYGVTGAGGAHGDGVVFEIAP